MRAPLILIPPSEAKRDGGWRRARSGPFDDHLATAREEVRGRLGDLLHEGSEAEIAAVLGVRGALLERAREATAAVLDGRSLLRPAWQRYSGVVWSHLRPETLTASQRRRLIVPSGLYGLNVGDDLIADYRLKMSARVGATSLAAWWRPFLATSLVRHAHGRVIYDLLPLEHRSALAAIPAERFVTVTFSHGANGRLAGHDAKAAKGAFARHLLGGDAPDSFSWGGWTAHSRGDALEVIYNA